MVTLLESTVKTAFIYEFAAALEPGHAVALAGSFNDWEPDTAPMPYDPAKKAYTCRVSLEPGIYEYKFVIDDEWLLDEDNPDFAPNDLGTLNSVLNVD